MGKRRRRSSRDSFWTQQYGGMPVWGLAAAVAFLLAASAVAIPAALAPNTRAEAREPRPIPTATEVVPENQAVFIGDSYAAGYRLPSYRSGFAYLAAEDLGWSPAIFAQPGTGYVSAGFQGAGNSNYLARLPRIPDTAKHLIFTGGVNDEAAYRENPDAFRAAVADTLAAAQERAPEADLTVVGPFWPYDEAASITEMNNIIRVAAEEAGGVFIDPLTEGWMDDVPLLDDGLHPTIEGQRMIADRLAAALR